MENKVFISVAKEHMKEKNYNPKAIVIAQDLGYIKEGNRVIDRQEFTAYLQETLKMTKYKCKKVIDTFVDTGILLKDKIDDNLLIMPSLKGNFLRLLRSTTRFCLNGLSDFAFKVYCYLFNKYNINQTYQHNENFFFSKKQILEDLGYSRGQDKLIQLNDALSILQDLHMISYNEEAVGRPGKHGTYHELYRVYEYNPTQVKALDVTIKELGTEVTEDLIADRKSIENIMMFEESRKTIPSNWGQLKERNK